MNRTREELERAVNCHRTGRLQEAALLYRGILERDPGNFDATHLLGALCIATRQVALGVKLLRRCIALNPGVAEAHNNLGLGYREMGEFQAAEACYRKALELRPDYPEAYNNLGIVLRAMHRFEDAEDAYRRALALKPQYAEAHNNLGAVHHARHRLGEALACYRAAYAINPDYGKARNNEALALLLAGRWREGWRHYEARWRVQARPPDAVGRIPLWTGAQNLEGATILLHAEQGLGDSIQFARYVPLVARRARAVHLCVQAPLKDLFAGSFPDVDGIHGLDEPPSGCDLRCPLLDLPGIFGTEPHTVPSRGAYLSVDEHRVARWRDRLGPRVELRVGVVWSGNPNNPNDRERSIPLEQFAALFRVPGCRFFALQKERTERDAATLAVAEQVTDLSGAIDDFVDTAAIILNLDLVVTVDTSVAHLAAALGRRTWVLIAHAPDWRWLLGREDSPWYESVRLLRQGADWEWSPVLDALAKELQGLAARPC
ncbi:photosystem I assembly protein Ycf3 [mine drainage metagenome]|uniref:Photosystem I assembly protein Ycf3 n=1 Tax=mine drainage metagenome TaxID=410659 RepID=A0A1J5SU81_9ZZZZ